MVWWLTYFHSTVSRLSPPLNGGWMKPANNSNQNSWKKSRHINLKNNIKTKYIITFIIYAMIFLYIYFFTMFMWILNKYLYYLLTVLDENDETPLFDPQTVTVNLLENVTVNSLIHTFTATDRDASSTPRNSEIEYVFTCWHTFWNIALWVMLRMVCPLLLTMRCLADPQSLVSNTSITLSAQTTGGVDNVHNQSSLLVNAAKSTWDGV